MNTVQSTRSQIDRRQSAVLHRACRRLAPDIWLAVRFLPHGTRDRVLAVAAILRLLSDLVAGREVENDLETGHRNEDSSHEHSGGCGCGSGSLEMRVIVAQNVVAYLFGEAVPGTVGRPDLEAFVAVRQSVDLPRAAFDDYVAACGAAEAVRRLATRRALYRVVDGLAMPLAEILRSVLLDGEADAVVRRQSEQAVRFIVLARELLTVRCSVVDEDRCFIPLEMLSDCELRDTEFAAWLRGGAEITGQPRIDQRGTHVLDQCKLLCMSHLAGAVHLIESLPGAPARAFAAFVGLWGDAVLREPIGRLESSRSLAERLRAHRFRAWRSAISMRFDPRLIAALSDASSSRQAAQEHTSPIRTNPVTHL